MNCDNVRVLFQAGSSALDADEQAFVSGHVAACRECRAELQRVQKLDALISRHVAATPVRGMEQTRVMLSRTHAPRRRWRYEFAEAARRGSRFAMPIASVLAIVFALFAAVPFLRAGWTSFTAQPANVLPTGRDKLWLVEASPTASAPLDGVVPFEVTVGYNLASAREATLSLRLAGEPTDPRRYFVEPVVVRSSETEATIRFTLDAARARAIFGDSPVRLEAILRAASGDRVLLASERFGGVIRLR